MKHHPHCDRRGELFTAHKEALQDARAAQDKRLEAPERKLPMAEPQRLTIAGITFTHADARAFQKLTRLQQLYVRLALLDRRRAHEKTRIEMTDEQRYVVEFLDMARFWSDAAVLAEIAALTPHFELHTPRSYASIYAPPKGGSL